MTGLPIGLPHEVARRHRPRILIYVQDSWGLGHIQRVSKLARALQDEADCVIICGHREAGWIIPPTCEYLRIPSLNVPLSSGSRGVFWGRVSPWKIPQAEAIELRRKLIAGAIAAFAPDAIVVENRPLGMMDELRGVLDQTDAIKFFLTRGIMTHPRDVRSHYLGPDQEQALRSGLFRRIIVAADRKAWDLASEYALEPAIAGKLDYVGYMSDPIDDAQIRNARRDRGIPQGAKWIVCSAGGGAMGERLIQGFTKATADLTNVVIDIVQGPHSALARPCGAPVMELRHVRVHRECHSLPLWHAAADLVVCPGGYNSLMEVMEGGAPIVTISVQPDTEGEQSLLTSRLSRYYPITLLHNYDQLRTSISGALAKKTDKLSIRKSCALNFDGTHNARDLILSSVRDAK